VWVVAVVKPVTLPSGRHWKTRTLALEHFKAMLSRYELDESILPGADHDDLLALLQYYDRELPPGAPTKLGAGVERFSKGRAGGDGYSTVCFFVHRVDGTADDFSYIRAINS
jgi:hypothetical protein